MKRRETSPAERVQSDVRAFMERREWRLTQKILEMEEEREAYRAAIDRHRDENTWHEVAKLLDR